MNKQLKAKTQQWMSLERKTLEQRKLADEFYDSELMNLIVSEYIANNKKSVLEKVDYLVVSVGTSYEPLVLNISLLKPKKILLLYTEKSEAVLEKVVNYCRLRPQDYEKRKVDSVDPMAIYREIKESYLAWKKPERMYIDFTGGTKAMSTACALAGAMIDIQMIYVSTDDYLTDFRKPNPGSERLSYVENPIAVFGDLEVDKALELMTRYNYAGAAEKLGILKERIPDPSVRQQLQFLYLLSRTYEYWDALDFGPAHDRITQLCEQMHRDHRMHPDFVLMDSYDLLMAQKTCLDALAQIPILQEQKKREEILRNEDIMHPLMFTMYLNAMIREQQEKYDMATLLMYRLLEMIGQRRLIHYNIYVSDPEYQKIDYSFSACQDFAGKKPGEQFPLLKDKVFQLKQQLFKKADSYLPAPIALLDGFLILAALEDPVTDGADEKENSRLNMLKRMRSNIYLRNNSIFAHGLGPVSKGDYEKFRDFIKDLFIQFCAIENVNFTVARNVMNYVQAGISADELAGWNQD